MISGDTYCKKCSGIVHCDCEDGDINELRTKLDAAKEKSAALQEKVKELEEARAEIAKFRKALEYIRSDCDKYSRAHIAASNALYTKPEILP